jgi:hypothetical protein
MLQDMTWDMDEVGKMLWGAAGAVRERGHCKGLLEDSAGRVCLVGAIMVAMGFDHPKDFLVSWRDRAQMVEGVERCQKFLARDPITWNNQLNRTAEEVIEVLEKVALRSKRFCEK